MSKVDQSYLCIHEVPPLQPRGGGGTLIFSSYVGSGPASTLHSQKYQEFQAPQKIFEILAAQNTPT